MSVTYSLRAIALWCVGCLTVCAVQSAAHAQGERSPAVLNYRRGAELPGCPSEQSLRRSVAAHLGYDPFQGAQGIVVDASIEPASPGLTAHVQARGEDGAALGKRELRSERGDCVELSRALALAISVAIDPFVLSRAESAPPAEPAPIEPEPAPPGPSDAQAQPGPVQAATTAAEPKPSDLEREPRRPYLSLDAVFGWGFVPAPRGALAVSGFWPLGELLMLQAELRYDLPGSDDGADGGKVSASLAGARVHACAGPSAWGACLGSAQSVLLAAGEGVDEPEKERAWLPAASLFGYAHVFRGERWLIQLRAGADFPLRRSALELNGQTAWTSPRVAPYAALGVGWVLP